MVVKRQCSFCASEIEPGTGWTFVKRDGTVFHFCSSSCRKQQLHLGRVGHRFKWTRAHALRVAAEHSATEKPAAPPKPAAPVKSGRAPRARPKAAPTPPPSSEEAPPAAAEAAPAETKPAAPAPAKPRARARKKPASAAAEED